MVERFVDVFKRAVKKVNGIETLNKELQKFLFIYRITPNVNASSGKAPQPNSCLQEKFVLYSINWNLQKKEMDKRKNTKGKHDNPNEKIYFKNYKFGKYFFLEVLSKWT